MPKKSTVLNALEPVSNDGAEQISFSQPYIVSIAVEGSTPMLFHRWSVESVEEKARAAKGSKAKKTDDIASYVYRGADGKLAIPTEYFRQSMINAAKFQQDPRSPRKSAMDLFKAGILCLEEFAGLGLDTWEYVDARRVTVQRQGITRQRPALNAGWRVEFSIQILLPEYIPPALLNKTVTDAGRLVGVGDNRPSYGRFSVTKFEVLDI